MELKHLEIRVTFAGGLFYPEIPGAGLIGMLGSEQSALMQHPVNKSTEVSTSSGVLEQMTKLECQQRRSRVCGLGSEKLQREAERLATRLIGASTGNWTSVDYRTDKDREIDILQTDVSYLKSTFDNWHKIYAFALNYQAQVFLQRSLNYRTKLTFLKIAEMTELDDTLVRRRLHSTTFVYGDLRIKGNELAVANHRDYFKTRVAQKHQEQGWGAKLIHEWLLEAGEKISQRQVGVILKEVKDESNTQARVALTLDH